MPLLIGITGKARSGKDTIAEILHTHYEFTCTAFAGPLKAAALIAFSDEPSKFSTQEGKASTNHYWSMTRRKMLQDFGEAMCKEFGEQFWIKRWFLDYSKFKDTDHIVVTDVRKDIEASFIRAMGGVVVHVQREGAGLQGAEGQHVTERGVERVKGDVVIRNDGSIADLHGPIANLVEYAMKGEVR